MESSHRLLAASFVLFSITASAATIYECRAYNGTNFLSNNYCSQSNGIGIRNWTVPDNMNFDQQVQNVEAAKAKEASRLQAEISSKNQTQAGASNPNQNKAYQCQRLDAAISTKDSELRQPHSAQRGDYLTEERKKLMDQRFGLGC
jgi:hypothetical protein